MPRYLTVPLENVEHCLNGSYQGNPEPVIVDEKFVGLKIGRYRIYPDRGQLVLTQEQPELSYND